MSGFPFRPRGREMFSSPTLLYLKKILLSMTSYLRYIKENHTMELNKLTCAKPENIQMKSQRDEEQKHVQLLFLIVQTIKQF